MVILPLFGFDIGVKSMNVTAQNRLNLYCEIHNDQDKTTMNLYRTAGLIFKAQVGASASRGDPYTMGTFMYIVSDNNLYEVNNANVATVRGTLNTHSGRVFMKDNGTQLMIVDGVNGYIYTPGTTTFVQITDPDFPNGATTVDFQGGFFIVDNPAGGAGRWNISASYDGTSWDATKFATAESNPDALVRVIVNQGIVTLLGAETTEFWGNTGALDFPYSPIQGMTLEWGLAARNSVAKINNSLAMLATSNAGHVEVVMMSGGNIQIISSPEVHQEIDGYSVNTDATGFAYEAGAHRFYQINFPSAGKSWIYDATSSQMAGFPVWSRVSSGTTGGRHLADGHCVFLNQHIVTDYSNGNLYTIEEGTYTDNSQITLWKLTSKHLFKDNKMMAVGRVWVDFETGTGLSVGQGSDPQVMLRYSKDGGHSWSSELWVTIGAIGKYLTRALWQRLGRARDWVFELSGSDPVKIVIMNAGCNVKLGRE